MNAQEAFAAYVGDAGSREEAAKRLNITVGMVGHVLNGVRNLSVGRAKMVESQTAGRISRHDLRPDIFGPSPTQQGEAA